MKICAKNIQTLAAYDQYRKNIFYPKTDIAELVQMCTMLKSAQNQDLERYREWVHRLCLSRWGYPPTHLIPICNTGTFHLLYHIVYSEQEFILRLNRIPEQKVAWEFLIDQWVRPYFGLDVIDIDFSRTVLPTDYQVVTYIPGKQLNAFEDPETQYMSPALLRNVGAYVARVHQIKLRGFGLMSLTSLPIKMFCDSSAHPEERSVSKDMSAAGLHETWQAYIFLRLHEHIKICKEIGAITNIEAENIAKILSESKNLLDIPESNLLHGDLGNHNFLSPDGITISALIDWEDCMAGDPVFDIAYWGTFFKDHMLNDFLVGYQSVAQVPVDFLHRYWLYYLRIALSKTVHRHYFGYQDKPGRVPASTRIQKALGFFY